MTQFRSVPSVRRCRELTHRQIHLVFFVVRLVQDDQDERRAAQIRRRLLVLLLACVQVGDVRADGLIVTGIAHGVFKRGDSASRTKGEKFNGRGVQLC